MRLAAILLLTILFGNVAEAQKRVVPTGKTRLSAARGGEIGQSGVIIDETLSVLRTEPSLFSEPVHRMQRGRKVTIQGVTEADGVKFYKVAAPPTSVGWVQADAVFGKFRPGDEERFSKLIQAADGFDQIEMAHEYFEMYPASPSKPTILLLYGDLLEEWAARHTKEANSQLKRAEMAASGAPMHSYFLNFVKLDRFRKLGIVFLFNPTTKQFHYNGASWKEIVTRFPSSPQAAEAQKRLDTLTLKMEKPAPK